MRVSARSRQLAVNAVAFDLDGTLLETGPDLAASANAMLRGLGLAAQTEASLIGYIGHGMANLVRRALKAALGREPKGEEVLLGTECFRAHYRENLCARSQIYPGAVEGLTELQRRGLRLACITNKPEEFARPLLERTGLSAFIEYLVGGDTLPEKKPDPQPLLHVAAYFTTSPAQLLLVGDSLVDVQAARAAGSPVFVVSYGYSGGVPADALDADRVIGGLDEIAGFLQQ